MKFNLSGYNLNNILRTLHVKKVKIYNLKIISNKQVEFEVNDKDSRKVKRQIKNVESKITPSVLKNYKKYILANVGIILGCVVGIFVAMFLSNFTWQIEVFGLKDLTKSEILNVLEENGVKKGKINTKTSEEIESVLLNNYDRIAQVSVIKTGTSIIINLSEKLIYQSQEFKPIVAKFSGVVTNINLITGTNNVKVGDFVNVGDVLVLPYNINADGTKVNVEPIAEIKAQIFITNQCELNKIELELQPTGRKCVRYKYKLFNKKIFSSKNKNSFALFFTSVYNENVSRLVPFSRDVVTYHELKQVEVEHDFNLEKQELEEKCKEMAYQKLPSAHEVLGEKTQTHVLNDKMIVITTLTISGVIHDWTYQHRWKI